MNQDAPESPPSRPSSPIPVPPGLRILHEDRDMLVVNKFAGLVCHPSKHGPDSSLVGRARLHLGCDEAHLVHRLDRETSGVVVIAKHRDVARRLRRLWERRRVEKEYWCLVHGRIEPESGQIDAALGRDDASEIAIKDCVRPDGSPAVTRFTVIRRFTRPEGAFTWVRAWPLTGRKHQIRIHFAHLGHRVVGDKLYGDNESHYLDLVYGRLTPAHRRALLVPYQALHARGLRFPYGAGTPHYEAEPERWFQAFLEGHPIEFPAGLLNNPGVIQGGHTTCIAEPGGG